MSRCFLISLVFGLCLAGSLPGQPSYNGPVPDGTVIEDATLRRTQYLDRVNEVIDWRIAFANQNLNGMDLRSVGAMLVRRQNLSLCSQRVIDLMQSPRTGPFWMLPTVGTAYLGRGLLTPAAQDAIRQTWQTTYQQRGDTENHFLMYYASLYLMCQLYPQEPEGVWFNGKSSAQNLAESHEYLLHWMDVTTSIGRGEYNSTSYIAEYAIPLIYLMVWADDAELRQRARMMLDWIYADLAVNCLQGMLRGPNSRADDNVVAARWSSTYSSQFAWMNFNACPPRQNFGAFAYDYAFLAAHYEVPEVIYRIAMDREGSYTQRDLKRTGERFRGSSVRYAPVSKTSYMTEHYAVGSHPAGLGGRIQEHVWDVTWAVPDPRGVHNSMFSVHPHSSAQALQISLSVYPDTIVQLLAPGGKPSYDEPDKLLGSSPYEQVFQHKDTVVALYDIPPGTRFPQVNGFFSKDLVNLEEHGSGWIFAQGGDTYLAYRPLAGYHWISHRGYRRIPSTNSGRAYERYDTGSRVLVSPHLHNGTIVQAAPAADFANFAAFKQTVIESPLSVTLDPKPRVEMRTWRGEQVVFAYDEAPQVNGREIGYEQWKLFEGPHLNAEKNGRRLVLTHGDLRRVIDFNTLELVDTAVPPTITPAGGEFPGPVEVSLGHPHTGVTVRYTLDGSEPTATSPVFQGSPFVLTQQTQVRARAFALGMAPSDVVEAAFDVWESGRTVDMPASGGNHRFDVISGHGDAWEAYTDAPWITLRNARGSPANQVLDFDVAATTQVNRRQGNIWVRRDDVKLLWVTVDQVGASGVAAVNMSTRAQTSSGTGTLVLGMVLKGPQRTKLLMRGIGPGLTAYGVPGALDDPRLVLYRGSSPVLQNGDWEEGAQSLAGYFEQVGAFALDEDSRDAALYYEAEPGAYTLHVSGPAGGQGIALAEIYAVEPEVIGSGLVNLSTRAHVGAGAAVLVPGFVITGDQPQRVLIRGVGPGLEPHGVAGYLPDPQIEVYAGGSVIATNDNWEDTDAAALQAAFGRAGAFPLAAGSRDAAILLELAPGAYTAHIRSTGTDQGVALLEAFFLPQ